MRKCIRVNVVAASSWAAHWLNIRMQLWHCIIYSIELRVFVVNPCTSTVSTSQSVTDLGIDQVGHSWEAYSTHQNPIWWRWGCWLFPNSTSALRILKYAEQRWILLALMSLCLAAAHIILHPPLSYHAPPVHRTVFVCLATIRSITSHASDAYDASVSTACSVTRRRQGGQESRVTGSNSKQVDISWSCWSYWYSTTGWVLTSPEFFLTFICYLIFNKLNI